jgi:hypothetical protein
MPDAGAYYLYRGTTRDWPGSEATRMIATTCTTTDPFISAHFAIECRNKGESILLAIRRGKIREVEANHFAIFESAVNLDIAPEVFPSMADACLDVDQALQYLRSLGFEDIPVRIRGITALHDSLKDSYSAGLRMNADQISRFNALMFGGQP